MERFITGSYLSFPTTDSAGNRFVAGVGVDISERRRAEEALAHQAQREAMSHRISQAIRSSSRVMTSIKRQ
jgi:hypothetical protein